jgi:DNA-binding cell septation regulator SpoVG
MHKRVLTAFLLVVMFSNTGNYGLSAIMLAFGRDALARGTIYFVVSAALAELFATLAELFATGFFKAGASGTGSTGTRRSWPPSRLILMRRPGPMNSPALFLSPRTPAFSSTKPTDWPTGTSHDQTPGVGRCSSERPSCFSLLRPKKEFSSMEIQVIQTRLLPGDRSLKAFCDVRVNDWLIHDFRIIKQNGQRVFVSPPQVSWKDPETGQIKYKGVLTIPSEQKQSINIEILSAFQREMENLNAEQIG